MFDPDGDLELKGEAAALAAMLREQLARGEKLRTGEVDAQQLAEWKLETEPLIAGVVGSAEILAAFLGLGRRPGQPGSASGGLERALELLRQAIVIAERPEASPGPVPRPALAARDAPAVPISDLGALDDALLLAELADAPLQAREEAADHLRAVRQELDRERPSWAALKPRLVSLAGFDRAVFLAVAAWLVDRAEAIA